jgi:hypothetical protein
MGITTDEVVAVIDFDHVAVGRVVLLSDDHATGSRKDRRARISRKVQPRVQGRPAGNRVDPPPKRGTQADRRDGLLRRNHGPANLLIEQPRFHDGQQVGSPPPLLLKLGQRRLQLFQRKRWPGYKYATAPGGRFDVNGIHAGQARNTFAKRFQLHHLGLHFANPASHGIQVFAHEPVTLIELILDHQSDQGTHHGPAFAGAFQKNPVIETGCDQHEAR